MAHIKKLFRGKFDTVENVEYVLRDKYGRVKKIWADNFFGDFLLRVLRRIVPQKFHNLETIAKGGMIAVLAALALYGVRIPTITGQWSDSLVVSNLVTSAGKAGVASRINGAGSEAAFTYIAIGTGTTAAAIGDTALQTEIASGGGSRAAATASRVTTTVTNDTAQLQVTFTFTTGFAVTESGVLNAASTGTLLNRQVFSAVNVANTDTLQVTHKFAVS